MVKINFEQLRVYRDIEHKMFDDVNVKTGVANELYEKGQGIAFHALAMKIYNSQGDTEYTDEEYELIMNYANQMCRPSVIDALMNCKQKEDKDNE